MEIIQLASFTGNIGDSANHFGMRKQFPGCNFHELEIREFYWGRSWDEIPQIVNQYDQFMIGGGNFFELWPNSRTSCSIDLPPEILKQIEVPIRIQGIGVDAAQGIFAKDRFERFLGYLLEHAEITVRNDGSRQTLKHLFGVEVPEIPDGGFFVDLPGEPEEDYVAVNLAGDMAGFRFGRRKDEFLKGLVDILKDHRVVFVPHIWQDLEIISQVLSLYHDRIRRTRAEVAPFRNRGIENFAYYKRARKTIAMRFHANVVPIAMGCDVIGINSYPQIQYLYQNLGLNKLVSVNDLSPLRGFLA